MDIKQELGNVGVKRLPLLKIELRKVADALYLLPATLKMGVEVLVICPDCKSFVCLKATKERNVVTCKKCSTQIRYIAKGVSNVKIPVPPEAKASPTEKSCPTDGCKPTEKSRPTEKGAGMYDTPQNNVMAKIVWGGFLNRKSKHLKLGSTTIGRADDERHSDIEINDAYASAQSVQIETISSGHNYSFRLTVLKAYNPVLVRGEELPVGAVAYLNYGDTFILGNTTLTLKRADK